MTNDERLAAAVAKLRVLFSKSWIKAEPDDEPFYGYWEHSDGDGPAPSDITFGDVRALLSALQVAERAQPQGEAVAWVCVANRGSFAPRYLVWSKGETAGLARADQCYYEPLFAAPPPAAQPAVPEWFVLVPKEPTKEMCAAPNTIVEPYAAKLIYKRMLAAAPGGEGK